MGPRPPNLPVPEKTTSLGNNLQRIANAHPTLIRAIEIWVDLLIVKYNIE